MTFPRFLVNPEALCGSSTVLTGAELRHLRVRRLRIGSELVLCDGLGCEQRGVVVDLDRRRAVIQFVAVPSRESSPMLRLALAQALLKGDKLDLVVEKATELGVSELLLFTCERTVTRVGADRRARWERVARSAAKQCRRSDVPVIEGPLCFEDVLSHHTDQLRLLFWEGVDAAGLSAVQREYPTVGTLLSVVGPEGGFSTSEAAHAASTGFRLVSLGPRILRAETAALVATTLCQFLWGDLKGDTN